MLSLFNKIFPQSQQDIIVFSHSRWNPVFKYPQRIVSRLAKKKKILFIEEPIPFQAEGCEKASIFYPQKNITVLQPNIAVSQIKQELPLLIAKQIRRQKMRNPVLWFYSSLFNDIIPYLNHRLIVYDYMSGQTINHSNNQTYLFTVADIIFTGDKMFYESERRQLSNLYYLHPEKKTDPSKFWDETVVQMQDIMRKVERSKVRARHQFIPFFYPFVPQGFVYNNDYK